MRDGRGRAPARGAEGCHQGGDRGRDVGGVPSVDADAVLVVVAPAERERRLRAASRPRRYAEQGEVFAVARGGGRRRGEQPLVARRGRGEQSFQRGTSRPLVRVFSE